MKHRALWHRILWRTLQCAISIILSQCSLAQSSRRYCVIVGCVLPAYDVLNCTLSDARLMSDELQGPSSSERLLLADDGANLPTRANIFRALKEQIAQCGPGDTFWFYFSGHGAQGPDGGSYLVPYDYVPGDLKSWVSVHDIRELLTTCRARTKVLILDACHSGSTKGLNTKTWDQLARQVRGQVTMAAAKPGESALESKELNHGVFTFFLVRGLAGDAAPPGATAVTLADLDRYVTAKVSGFAEKTIEAIPQHPQFIYDSSTSDQPVSTVNQKELSALQIPEGTTVYIRPNLKPSIALLFRGEQWQLVHNELRHQLLDDKFPTISDEMSAPFERALVSHDPSTVSQAVSHWGAVYLLRGNIRVSASNLTGEFAGMVSAQASITAELVDVDGNVLASVTSDDEQGPVTEAGVSYQAASNRALREAADKVYEAAKTAIEKALQGNKSL